MKQPKALFVTTSPSIAIAFDHDPLLLRGQRWLARRAKRGAELVLTLVPLLLLLVGSCKTADLPDAYGKKASAEQLRIALFPDQVRVKDTALYKPARGYVQRAQGYVADVPETLEKLTAREIGYIFGTPQWQRKDGIAKANVWQYSTGECVVDFYFYGDTAENVAAEAQPVVSYADVRQRSDAHPLKGDAESDCLRAVMKI